MPLPFEVRWTETTVVLVDKERQQTLMCFVDDYSDPENECPVKTQEFIEGTEAIAFYRKRKRLADSRKWKSE